MLTRNMCIYLIIVVLVFVLFPTWVFADYGATGMPEDMDVEYIVERIVAITNGHIDSLERMVTREDIDLSGAYKIYLENVFNLPVTDFNDVKEILEKGVYIFEVPIKIGENTYVANLQLVGPVDDRDEALRLLGAEWLADYEKRVGTWDVSVVYAYLADSPFKDYYETASNISNIRGIQPLLVGGLPGFRMLVAIYPDESGNMSIIVPTVNDVVQWDALGMSRSEYEGKALDYATIKEAVQRLPPSDGRTGGSSGDAAIVPARGGADSMLSGTRVVVAISVVLCAIVVFGIVIRKRRNKVLDD